jgi:hypothetical protein
MIKSFIQGLPPAVDTNLAMTFIAKPKVKQPSNRPLATAPNNAEVLSLRKKTGREAAGFLD